MVYTRNQQEVLDRAVESTEDEETGCEFLKEARRWDNEERITIKMIITMIMIIITRINGERRNRIKSTVRLACGDEALSKENNGNICSCVTSHGSFDVIKKLLWTLIKDTIILLALVFVLLLLL